MPLEGYGGGGMFSFWNLFGFPVSTTGLVLAVDAVDMHQLVLVMMCFA